MVKVSPPNGGIGRPGRTPQHHPDQNHVAAPANLSKERVNVPRFADTGAILAESQPGLGFVGLACLAGPDPGRAAEQPADVNSLARAFANLE